MSVDKTNYPPQKKTTNGCGSWSGTCTHFKPSRGLVALSVVVVIVIAATFVVWTNDFIRVRLNKNIGLENNTLSYRMWEKPPVSPIMAVYIFNYTNANEFQKGIDKKLKVQEVGPYVYREHAEKVNVVFNPNGTVSYQQKTSFSYVPELSAGHRPRQEYITVPNIPLLVSMTNRKNGILRNRVTMYTGKEDVQMLGVISRFNGEERLHHWSGKDCNRIDGTDGSLFPPNLVKRNSTIHVFSGEICRRFPLEYSEDIIAHGRFPALRFRAPRDVFANPDVNPENACYCHPDTETCPPSGIFNASPCAFGAPVMISFPHFYLGDPSLLQTVEGLKPDPQKHYGYLDLHEELGVPLDGKSRFQLNMMVRSSSTLRQLANFKDGSILPIAWFDVGIEGLPEEIMDLLYHVTFTTRHIQLAVQYVLLVMSIVLIYVLARSIRSRPTVTASSDVISPI
ncbi:scavenger receptor class B member 1-like [Zootermopsis nevadensis]|uniref:scavenger receptor class B member 1-like n=1 Tax=Zootermopsis nevadensis TaxID=136037 RepID=UPI000B8E38D8|nr:scavenger receptor class B member 1-like [Zootermopsis nevadensis]